MNLLPIVRKEIRQLLRDPRTLVMLVLMPLLIAVMFGLGYGSGRGKLPIATVNLDKGPLSWKTLDTLESVGEVKIKYDASSVEEAVDMIRDGKVYGAVVVPEGFTESLVHGESTYIIVIVDQTNPHTSAIVYEAAKSTAYALQVSLSKDYGFPAITVSYQTVYGPTVTTMESFTPVTMTLLLHLVPMTLISMSICKEREMGTYERLIMAPVSRWEIIGGKLVAYFLVTAVDMVVTLLFLVTFFDVQVRGSIIDLSVFSALMLICSLSMGMLLSVVSKNQLQAVTTSIFLFIPSLLFGGIVSAVELISPAVRTVLTYGLPVYYFLNGFRMIMVRGAHIAQLVTECEALGLMTVAYFLISILMLRMRVD